MVIGFTSARGIRGAVRRNRIKRLLREAYRLQQKPLARTLRERGVSLQGVLMFIGQSPSAPGMIRLADLLTPVGNLLTRLPEAVSARS
jgi:hypothetical protein